MTPSDTPTVSIGMPVYNGMPYLPATLESILSQSYADLQVVICDNASIDETQAVCARYAASDARIRYVRNLENIGASGNYNRVFEYARGRYFKWAAADDLLAPTMVERCVAALEANPAAALAFPGTTIIDAEGRSLHRVEDEVDVSTDDAVARVREIWSMLRECNAVFGLIRREILAQTNLIGCYIAADANLLAELAMHGQFIRVQDFLFFRREHAASSSADKSVKAQLHFYDPTLGKRFIMSRWLGFWSDLRAIRRAPLAARQRLVLCEGLLRRMYWARDELVSEIRIGANQFVALNGYRKTPLTSL